MLNDNLEECSPLQRYNDLKAKNVATCEAIRLVLDSYADSDSVNNRQNPIALLFHDDVNAHVSALMSLIYALKQNPKDEVNKRQESDTVEAATGKQLSLVMAQRDYFENRLVELTKKQNDANMRDKVFMETLTDVARIHPFTNGEVALRKMFDAGFLVGIQVNNPGDNKQ